MLDLFLDGRGALSPQDFKAKFLDQKVWSAKAFTSTSIDATTSIGFAMRENQPDRVGFLMHFAVTNGRDINKLSLYGHENEILLLPGASATVLGITEDPGRGISIVHLQQTS